MWTGTTEAASEVMGAYSSIAFLLMQKPRGLLSEGSTQRLIIVVNLEEIA